MSVDQTRLPFDERFSLAGQVALVTGGSRGLGKAIAFGFADAGADVIIASRKLEACEEVAKVIENETGREAFPYACHVGDWDQIDRLVGAAYERFGRVDVLVNNAGMSLPYEGPADITQALWDKVNDVNVKGPFRLIQVVGQRMLEGDGGSIVNISTTGAANPRPESIPYHAAKAALNALTVAFARAWAPKVRVNAIMPGGFMTDVANVWTEEMRQGKGSLYGRIGQPDEIVGAALYYASRASTFATGSILTVGGGPP